MPLLRWTAPADEPAWLEICVDRECGAIIETIEVTGQRQARVLIGAAREIFWRVRVEGAVSDIWRIRTPRSPQPQDPRWIFGRLDLGPGGAAKVDGAYDCWATARRKAMAGSLTQKRARSLA